MRAEMSFHLRQMNSLLYWFIPTVMYFNMLFLDNSVALNEYYTESESPLSFNYGTNLVLNKTDGDKLVLKDMGFTMRVQQESYNSLIALRNGTLFVTNSDNEFRSIRIVGGNVIPKNFSVDTYTTSIEVRWHDMPFCSSNPEVLVVVQTSIDSNGFIQCLISWGRDFPVPCFMTIEITKGVFDGDGNIDKQERIHSKVFKMDGVEKFMWIAFNPKLRCEALKSQVSCISESKRMVNCTWCEKCGECLSSALSCNCSVDTETTKSGMNEQQQNNPSANHYSTQSNSATDFQPHKNQSSNVYYIVVIVLGVVVIVLFIVGMIIWKYRFSNNLFSC
uniref:TonB box, N-terminal,domain-containing protein n=1 Tax=Schistosoma japonicum TaxID=6182 RepID=C1LJ16_SCHJA|nr:TonB box, N-terminal,domain-containing protein [Schistosoma japonicum]CAX74694.1 TonB box, N-terminal,domain-containing protein [Schistosoma japonicum]